MGGFAFDSDYPEANLQS